MTGHASPSTTATVNSRPGTNSSTRIGSLPASLSAGFHCSSDETLLMPTDEPSHGGFTTTGSGSGDFSVSGFASPHFAVGTFFISSTIFVFTLSIAICEARTPGPV